MALARKAGLVPETAEQLQYHVHAHLDVFVNGKKILVPAGLGIDITNPAVHTRHDRRLPGVRRHRSSPCDQPCISPLHTHDVDRRPPHRVGDARRTTRSGSSSSSGT